MSANESRARASPLLITYTEFPRVDGWAMSRRDDVEWMAFVRGVVQARSYPHRKACPLISFCEYGEAVDEHHDIPRYGANVLRAGGCEIDYDGGKVSMAEGAAKFETAGVTCVLHTTGRHTPKRPRWRVILPFSEAAPPAKRRELVGRANRVLGGIAAPESFKLAQAYYLGRVDGVPYETRVVEGTRTIDEAGELEPLYPPGKANGEDAAAPGETPDKSDDRVVAALKKFKLHIRNGGKGKHFVRCPWMALHTPDEQGNKSSGDTEACYFELGSIINGVRHDTGTFKCMHTHCATRGLKDLLDYLGLAPRAAGDEPDEEPWTDEPLNLFAKFAAPPLVAADLPHEIAEYPALYAEATGFDPTLTLSSALAVMAAAIPDQIQVCANSATRHFASARLWVMSLGRPGAAKSPGHAAMREPLDRLNVELFENWQAEKAAWEKEKEGTPPPQPTVVVNNVTLEAMSEALLQNERGVLFANDEAMSWLGSMDQYRSGGLDGDRAEWLRLFDGGHHVVHRIKRGTVFVKNWGASVLTATTPAALEQVARHLPEDGLLQRVMVFHVRSRQITSVDSDRGEIEAARERYTATVHRLWGLMPKEHSGVVPLAPEARSLLRRWEADSIKRQEAFGALSTALESHLAKYGTFALRLALTFHCAKVVNLADPAARDPARWPIGGATFAQVFRFLRREQQHAFALYLGLGKSATYELARDIARTILARHTASGTVQRRELMQAMPAFRKAERRAQDDALHLMIDAGWLRVDDSGYQKAAPARFLVDPNLTARFAKIAAEERERRAIARAAIAESAQDRAAEWDADSDEPKC
jgi:hypothetical protein